MDVLISIAFLLIGGLATFDIVGYVVSQDGRR